MRLADVQALVVAAVHDQILTDPNGTFDIDTLHDLGLAVSDSRVTASTIVSDNPDHVVSDLAVPEAWVPNTWGPGDPLPDPNTEMDPIEEYGFFTCSSITLLATFTPQYSVLSASVPFPDGTPGGVEFELD